MLVYRYRDGKTNKAFYCWYDILTFAVEKYLIT